MLYAQWDLDEYVAVQSREAEERGERRGELRGELRGERKKAIEVAISALEMGLTTEQAAKISKLSIEDVENLIIG